MITELIEKLIQSGEMIKLEFGDDRLNNEGKELFNKLCYQHGLPNPDYFRIGDEWNITDKDAEYKGTISKRYVAYLKNAHGWISIPNTFVSMASSLLKTHVATKETYFIRFTKKIDWENGEFGERSFLTGEPTSCFWTVPSRSGALEMISQNGFAIQVFYEDKRPRGRAWANLTKDDQLVIFNGYGLNSQNNTHKIAQVLSWWLNLPNKKIKLTNLGKDFDEGVLYINNGEGWLIGENVDAVNFYDLNWTEIKPEYCIHCSKTLIEDIVYDGYNQPYCYDCSNKYLIMCDESLMFYHRNYILTAPDGKNYHLDIFHSKFGFCLVTKQYYTYDKLVSIGQHHYILQELQNDYKFCEFCGYVYSNDEMYSDNICNKCNSRRNQLKQETKMLFVDNTLDFPSYARSLSYRGQMVSWDFGAEDETT